MDNFSDILSSLTPDDVESLKAAAASLFGSEDQSAQTKQAPPPQNSAPDFSNMFEPDMMLKMGKIMAAMNSSGNNSKFALINALKPLLSKDRRSRADEAMQMLNLFEMLPMIMGTMKKD